MFLGAYHKIFKSDVNERRTIEVSRDVRLTFKKNREPFISRKTINDYFYIITLFLHL